MLLVVPKIVFTFFAIVVMALLAFITSLIVNSLAGLNLDVQLRLISITTSIYPVLIAALINPIMIIADTLLYSSLKETSGGKA